MKKVFLFLTSLTVFLALVASGNAQAKPTEAMYQKVFPGDSVVNSNRIKPHKVKYEKGNYAMIYDLRKIEKDGKQIYEMLIYFGNETATPDKIYFDTKTLAYIGRRLELKDYTIDVKYTDSKFTGDLIPAKDSKYTPRKYDKAYSHTFFEPAIVNYFIAALPLKEGYKASVPTIDLNNGSEIWWANVEVLGREKVESNGKIYDTWKVLSKGIKDKTIWISTDEPFAVKMETSGNLGSWLVNESFESKTSKAIENKSISSNTNNNPDPLAFFAGTWKREGMEGFERWERKGETEFVGKGYKFVDEKEKSTETMEIKSVGGKVFLVANLLENGDGKPIELAFKGVSEVVFSVGESNQKIKGIEFSFENTESKIIKKIVYKKVSDTEMFVQITDGGGNGFSYKMKKQ
ncbi:MAG: hypothetical protein R2747_16950 [Pyrinomonadaceae bacterium]